MKTEKYSKTDQLKDLFSLIQALKANIFPRLLKYAQAPCPGCGAIVKVIVNGDIDASVADMNSAMKLYIIISEKESGDIDLSDIGDKDPIDIFDTVKDELSEIAKRYGIEFSMNYKVKD